MTENLSDLPESGPVKCCDACTCSNPHRSEPVEGQDDSPAVNVQES